MYIYFLNGVVSEINANLVVLDCGGVGYECVCSAFTVGNAKIGQGMKLYTYCAVREDAMELYGFSGKDEKTCFELLISVNGVGPKAAISILSSNTPSSLQLAVAGGDERALTRAPGIGKKIAQRIILELKDKLAAGLSEGIEVPQSINAENRPNRVEAMAALSALGYSNSEIAQALKNVDVEGMSTEQIVKAVLRSMAFKS